MHKVPSEAEEVPVDMLEVKSGTVAVEIVHRLLVVTDLHLIEEQMTMASNLGRMSTLSISNPLLEEWITNMV